MRVNMEAISKLLSPHSRLTLIIFTILFAFIWLFPPNYLYFLKGLSGYLPLHMLMETFSIIVAAMIFSVGWEAYIKEKTGNLVIISTVFLSVVFIDFAHMLSFAGMPVFVTPSDPEKAIFFWLCGRFFVAFGMLYIAINAWKPLKSYAMHYLILVLSLLATAVIYWIGLWHQDILPHTFIPGHGLTPLKIYLEWSVVAILAVAAVFLIKKMLEKKQEYDAQNILMAIYLMILSEIFFMLYADVADLYNFMGHVYKVVAYYYLYRAIFAENIQKPYRELENSAVTISDLYNNAPCGYHSLDKDGMFRGINDTELSWLGYTREEVVGKMRFSDIVTPKSLEIFKESFPAFKERGWVKDLEFELVRHDGTIFPVLVSATAIKDSDGNYITSRSTVYDISELKKAEEVLQESEEEYRTLIQKIQVAVVVHGADTQILTSNHMAQELLGLTEEQLLGKLAIDPAWHFFRSDKTIMPVEEYPVNQVVSTHQPLRNRVFGVHRPGQENDVWVLVNADPVFDKKNKIEQVIVTFIDITERVRAEQELRESEEKFSAAFHASPNLMVITRIADGTLLDVNEGYSRLLGYSREESIGKTTASLFIWADPADRATFVASLEKYGQITDFETTLRRKDGTIISVIDSARTIKLQGEMCILSVVYDITARKQMEQELREQERHSQSLLHLSKRLELAQAYGQVVDAAREEVKAVMGYQNIWVYLFNEDKKYAYALAAGGSMSEDIMSEEGTARLIITGDPMLEEIASAKDIVVVEDALTDPRTDKEIVAKLGNRTIVNVPIIFFDKHLGSVGMGTFGDEGVRVPTKAEEEYLRALASHLAVTLDRIHLLAERKKADEDVRKLYRIYRMLSDCNQSLMRADDENKLIAEVCRIITEEGGYRMVWVGYPQNDEGKTIKPVAYAGYEEGYLSQNKFSWGDNEYGRGPTGTSIRTGKYFTALHYDTEPEFSPWREEAKKRGYTSSVAFPLITEGKPFGALSIYSGVSDAFTEEELTLLQELTFDLAYGIVNIRTRIGREHIQVMLNEAQRITHIGSWELDLKNNVLTWSDEIYRMFEIDPAKFGASYEAFLDAIHPDDREAVNSAYTNSLDTKLPYSIEHRLLFPDGRIKYVKEQCETYYDKDGKPLRSVGTVQDVTELKQAEDALMYLSQRNELILNSAGEGIYGTDIAGNITFINPAAAKMLGFSIEELIGKNSHQVFHHTRDDGQPYPVNECPLHQSLKEGGIHRGENEVFWTKDGKKFYVEHVNTPLLKEGKIVGAVVVFRDITERKLVQEALRHAYAYNRSLIEASLDPLVTISPEGKITDVNAATEIVTGHPRNELLGTDFSDYFSEPEKAKAGYHQVFEVGFVKDYSLEIKHKDGHLTPVIYNASIYRDEKDQITGVFAAARDITKLKVAEMALHELNDKLELLVKQRTSQLEAANKELEAFTYSVSHDLRAPLRAIDGFSAAVMEDYGDKVGDDGKDYLQRVRNASQKMSTLIDDLLSLSRLTRGELNRVSTNLSDIASEVIKTLSESDPDRHVDVSIAENMMDEADPHFMEIVFTNLLNNAWKFTSKKEKAQIEFGRMEKDGKKIYYIKDNGAGFDMNYSVKLFQPFQRLHTAEEFPGTGIGLATVYRIIKKHGGEIWAEGKVDEGATFYFTLGG